jgi:hypothetical protein
MIVLVVALAESGLLELSLAAGFTACSLPDGLVLGMVKTLRRK